MPRHIGNIFKALAFCAVAVLLAPGLALAQLTDADEARYWELEKERRAAETPEAMQALLPEYEELRAKGHTLAPFRLGNIYGFGMQVPVDHARAAELYRESIDRGYQEAWRYMGSSLLKDGRGEEAFEAFEKARELGITGYELQAANAHLRRDFGKYSDPKQGVAMFEKLVEGGDEQAQRQLGSNYAYPSLGIADFERSRELLAPLAEEGNEDALEQMARLYAGGLGVERDMDRAAELYHQAFDAGKDRAIFSAAGMEIARGKYEKARASYREAIDKGVAGAELQYALALARNAFQRNGDRAEGTRMLRAGIERNDPDWIVAAMDIMSEGRLLRIDIPDLAARAERLADAGNGAAAWSLINMTRKRSVEFRDARGRRAEYIDRYADIMASHQTLRERVNLTIDTKTPREARESLETMLAGLDNDRQFYYGLTSVAYKDRTAYVYLLQKELKRLGYYNGPVNARMRSRTVDAVMAFCADHGYLEECRHGPLTGNAIRLIAGTLSGMRAGSS